MIQFKIVVLFLIFYISLIFSSIITYDYDNLNRLTKVVYNNSCIEQFQYDELGNRTRHTITAPGNQPPVVSNIPNQSKGFGETFIAISLDDFVLDPDNSDDELIWTRTGQTELSITIDPSSRIATISKPNTNWTGSETITFTATDPGGLSSSDNVSFTCNAQIFPPEITISATPQSITVGENVQFNMTNSGGSITTYSWDFGDGATSTVAEPIHVYQNIGTFKAYLTAIGSGGSDIDSIVITVKDSLNVIVCNSLKNIAPGDEGILYTPTFGEVKADGFKFTTDNDGNNTNYWHGLTSNGVSYSGLAGLTSTLSVKNSVILTNFPTIATSVFNINNLNALTDVSALSGIAFYFYSDANTEYVANVGLSHNGDLNQWSIQFHVYSNTTPRKELYYNYPLNSGNFLNEDINFELSMDEGQNSDMFINANFSFGNIDSTFEPINVSALNNESFTDKNTAKNIYFSTGIWKTFTNLISTEPQLETNIRNGFSNIKLETVLSDVCFEVNNKDYYSPKVTNIIDQKINQDQTFTKINLNDFVTDNDHADSAISWNYSGNNNLSIDIDPSNVATISSVNPNWAGSELISFTATDPKGLFDSDDASFTISPVNYKITVTSNGNGTILPAGDTTIDYNGSLIIIATPNSGYHFGYWETTSNLDIKDETNENTTIQNIKSNGHVYANFIKNITPGSITVTGLDSSARVYMCATSSWKGKNVLTGNGTISDLVPDTYILTVNEPEKRMDFTIVTVKEGVDTSIQINTQKSVPLSFIALDTVKDYNGVNINMSVFSSAVIDDIDKDGDKDLCFITESGTFYYYKNENGLQLENSFTLPLSGFETVQCLRLADFDNDNKPELFIGLNTGEIFSITMSGDSSKILYSASDGLTGFDFLDKNKDDYPDILLGYNDGTLYLAASSGNLTWSAPVPITDTADVQVIADTNTVPLSIDLSGDGLFDIICANSDTSFFWYKNNGSDKFTEKYLTNFNGSSLELNEKTSVSKSINYNNSLPSLTISDNRGNIYKAEAKLQGDIVNDGLVDILDLQQMGMLWGMLSDNAQWKGEVNLNLTPEGNNLQIIDILDLQVLGKCWGLKQ